MNEHVEVAITAPDAVSAGETANVDVEYGLPEFGVDDSVAVTIAVDIDGEVVGTTETTTEDGEIGLVTVTHQFTTPGEREIRADVVATTDDDERDGSATATLSVEGEARDDPLLDRDEAAAVSEPLIEDGWEVDGESEERVVEEEQGPVTVTGDAYTATYVKRSLQEAVAEDTFDAVAQPLMFFFATWVDFAPAVDSLPEDPETVVERVDEGARGQFREQLSGNGLTSVEIGDRYTTDVANGAVAAVTEYEAVYPLDDMSFEVAAGETITIEGEPIEIAATYAIWNDGEDVFIAGGAHPDENFATRVEERFSEAIEVELDIDLGLEPDAYESELLALIRSVQ